MNNFFKDLERGRVGENEAKTLFEENGWIVTNLSNDPSFYHKGDLMIEKDGTRFFVEVKTDYSADKTGNFVIESTTNMELNHKGWFYNSTADKLIIYLPNSKEFLLMDFNELKEKVSTLYPRKRTTFDGTKTGIIYLINILKAKRELNSFRLIQEAN